MRQGGPPAHDRLCHLRSQFKFGLAEYRARRFEKAVGAFTGS